MARNIYQKTLKIYMQSTCMGLQRHIQTAKLRQRSEKKRTGTHFQTTKHPKFLSFLFFSFEEYAWGGVEISPATNDVPRPAIVGTTVQGIRHVSGPGTAEWSYESMAHQCENPH